MGDLQVALLTIFGTVASVTGVVLYVFNGTRSLIKEIHITQKEIKQLTEEIKQLTEKIMQLIDKIDERAEQRHREILEKVV